jgi:ectoine hydroxylase-related dioxygenase (phytanoyl-CoA dioxygenase family)
MEAVMIGPSEQRAFYSENGYLIAEDLLTDAEVRALTGELTHLIRGAGRDVIGAVSDPGVSDQEVIERTLAVHHPHKLSPLVLDTVKHSRVVEVLERLIGPDLKAMQSMLFVKKAGKPGQAWHQDEFFIATRDRSLCGVWIALDDATIENGCLWVHPGSHKTGVLYRMEPHADDRFDTADEAVEFPYEREGGIPVELTAGSAVFFNGYTLHRSLPNRSQGRFRRALVTHYMSAHSLLPWSQGAPLAPVDVRDIVMVAGEDPYAWKGIKPASLPYVRPENKVDAAAVYSQLQAERTRLQD